MDWSIIDESANHRSMLGLQSLLTTLILRRLFHFWHLLLLLLLGFVFLHPLQSTEFLLVQFVQSLELFNLLHPLLQFLLLLYNLPPLFFQCLVLLQHRPTLVIQLLRFVIEMPVLFLRFTKLILFPFRCAPPSSAFPAEVFHVHASNVCSPLALIRWYVSVVQASPSTV